MQAELKIKKPPISEAGQSLAELVVALGVTVVMIAGLMVGITAAMRTTEVARKRSQAVEYAQQGMELARQLRDNDWNTFRARTGLWCLDQNGDWSQPLTCPVNLQDNFTRQVSFSWNATAQRMEVTTTVSWNDGAATHQSELTTYFTQWKQ